LDPAGKTSVRIDRTYPLADAAQAHEAFERRQVSGERRFFHNKSYSTSLVL